MSNVKELYKLREEFFVERRTIIANEVDKFMESSSKLDPELVKHIHKPEGMTARELLPAMWVKPFNKTQYLSELAIFIEYVNAIMAVADSLNTKALEVLR